MREARFAALLGAAWVVVLGGCGAVRDHLARDRYLRQVLCDYVLPAPREVAWREAMQVVGAASPTPASDGEAWVWRGGGLSADGEPAALLKVYATQDPGGGSRLRILRWWPTEDEPGPLDLHARAVEQELEVLRRLAPREADRLDRSAAQAQRRAKQGPH